MPESSIQRSTELDVELLRGLRERLPPFNSVVQAPPEMALYHHRYGLGSYFSEQCQYCAGTLQSGEFELVVQHWRLEQSQGTLLLVHGFTDHTGLFKHLIAWGLSEGWDVLIFDLPGHGLSSGEPLVIDDFADYAFAVRDVIAAADINGPLWVMAQSTGGAAVIEYARHCGGPGQWPFVATVLLAPLIQPSAWRLIKRASYLLQHFVDGVPRKLLRNTSDGAFLKVLKNDPLQADRTPLRWIVALRKWLSNLDPVDLGVGPALVIQGDNDATVDWRYNMPVIEKLFPGSYIEYLPGAGHQLANEAAPVRADYLARVHSWLDERGMNICAF